MYYWSGAVLLHCTRLHYLDLHWTLGFSHTLHPTALFCSALCALDCTAPTCNELQGSVVHCTLLHWSALHFDKLRTLPQEKVDPFVIQHLTFLFILSFVTKIRWFHVLLNFFRGGKYDYRHSKSITKPKDKIQPHLALQQYVFLESAFYSFSHYL